MHSHIPVCAFAVCSMLAAEFTFADDQAEIRQAVTYDSAMSHVDFKLMATYMNGIKPPEDNSLTWAIFSLSGTNDDQANVDFRFMHPKTLKPRALASAWQNEIHRIRVIGDRRILTGPITTIHADRITAITCDVKGDVATGVVTFKVPDLYQGKVAYVANKGESGWVIVEFEMPSRKIHLIRNSRGFWESKPE